MKNVLFSFVNNLLLVKTLLNVKHQITLLKLDEVGSKHKEQFQTRSDYTYIRYTL